MLFSRISSPAKAACGTCAFILLAAAALLPADAQTQTPAQTQALTPGVTGVWIDHTGRGAVEIHTCGTQVCGRIAWLKEPNDAKGAPAKDKKGRALCGLQIIGDLKPKSNTLWEGGWIYDPDKDDTFDVEIQLKARDRLQVLGYMGVKFLSETYMWKRAPETFTVCSSARPS
jgi:uncharacterized protein (DUF2147 family)